VKARKCNGIALDIVGRSDVGRVRTTNEDEIVFDSEQGIAILADGMGGLAAGEVASQAAAAAVYDALQRAGQLDEGQLRAAFNAANRQVLALSRAPDASAMGTTLVVWMDVGYGQCFVAHVGDSRAYRLRDHSLSSLTEDHSLVQQLINEGVLSKTEARESSQRNIITRAIGLEPVVQVDLRSWVRGQGDVFLLCSDGLTDMLSESELQQLLAGCLAADGSGDLEAAADELVAAANAAGGSDNVSVLLIRPD